MSKTSTDKLSFGQKIAYGMGAVAHNFIGNGIGALALPIYNIGLGVNAGLIGLALGIPRVLDAMLDPVMGHVSDNTRSRWGRRRPYIIFGGLAVGLLFALLWNPNPHWSTAVLSAFFLAITMLYYIMFTVWGIPYGALGFELSYDYYERTNVQAYKAFLAGVLGFALPWLYKMCFWSWDKLVACDAGGLGQRIRALTQHSAVKGAEVHGAGIVGIIIGAFIIITAVIPALCKEKTEVQSQEKIAFLPALKSTFKNKPYLIVTGISVLAFFGVFLVQPLALYVNIYYIFNGNKEAAATMSGWMGTIYGLTGVIVTPLVAKLANMLGKKQALIWSFVFYALGTVSIWWFYTPANPWLQVIPIFLFGPAWNCAMIVLPSMVADVCDLDELETGLRREGMYGAVNSWIVKLGIGAVTCVSGVVVTLVGVNPHAATQTVATLTSMRLAFIIIPVLFILGAIYLSVLYPLTEARAKEVRAILDARKDEAAPQSAPSVATGSPESFGG
jgi:glycoside/pentoside/hexuronide:cation symporter, GPH family